MLGRALRLAGVAAIVGIVGAGFLAQLLQGLLHGVTRLDPVTYVVLPVFFFGSTPRRRFCG